MSRVLYIVNAAVIMFLIASALFVLAGTALRNSLLCFQGGILAGIVMVAPYVVAVFFHDVSIHDVFESSVYGYAWSWRMAAMLFGTGVVFGIFFAAFDTGVDGRHYR